VGGCLALVWTHSVVCLSSHRRTEHHGHPPPLPLLQCITSWLGLTACDEHVLCTWLCVWLISSTYMLPPSKPVFMKRQSLCEPVCLYACICMCVCACIPCSHTSHETPLQISSMCMQRTQHVRTTSTKKRTNKRPPPSQTRSSCF